VPGTIISTLVLGLSLFGAASLGWITGIDASGPKEALQFGAMMSATDPIATLAVLGPSRAAPCCSHAAPPERAPPALMPRDRARRAGSLDVEPQLYSIIFGESVLNDAVAVVLFQTFAPTPDPLFAPIRAREHAGVCSFSMLPNGTKVHLDPLQALKSAGDFVSVRDPPSGACCLPTATRAHRLVRRGGSRLRCSRCSSESPSALSRPS